MPYKQYLKQLLAAETGAILKPGAYDLKSAVIFPNTYRVGMASLGFQRVFNLIAEQGNVLCERVFLPEAEHLEELERTGEQVLTCESLSNLSSFDILAFSLQFEMDYANVVHILDLAKIPVRSKERGETHPIVIAGGACATFNPEPMAEFVDIFVIGDAEPVIPGLVEALRNSVNQLRQRRLAMVSDLESVYVPTFPKKTKRAIYADKIGAVSTIFADDAEFGRVQLIEIARGCGRRCRFCVAGHIGRPVRYMNLSEYPENERLGLVGAAVLDHPDAMEYCNRIGEGGGSYTMSSIRLETLDDVACATLKSTGTRTVTIAPEAGSERLRRVLNKEVDEETILKVAQRVQSVGIPKLRMYFMIGLPTETDEDILAIVDLVGKIANQCPLLKLSVSTASFVPKPFTPFQWHPMASPKTLKSRYSLLRRGLSKTSNLDFSGESPRLAFVQGLFSRGDSSLANAIEIAAKTGSYPTAIKQAGVDIDNFIYKQKSFEEPLPWDNIDIGISKEYLIREYELALKEIPSGPCVFGSCRACGLCE